MTDSLKYLNSPDAEIIRARESARAKAGAVPVTGCPHPVSAIDWVIEDNGQVNRNGRPLNLFVCGVCGGLLRLVDFNGVEAKDA
jgi:hypothetical protein